MRLWVASLCFYAFVFTLCELLRLFVQKLVEEKGLLKGTKHHDLWLTLIYEFIGTVQLCTLMFDVNFVMENYGLGGVFVEITLIELINALLLRRALADPCLLLYNYVRGRHNVLGSSLLLATQFVAAYASYLVARQFFAFGLHPQHIGAFSQECSADLTVAILYGSVVEAVGLFAGKMAEYLIDDRVMEPKYINLVIAACSGLITILGINITGMYANPIVAWALTFNCEGVTHLGHFIVYWMAPMCAFFAAKFAFGDDENQIADQKVPEKSMNGKSTDEAEDTRQKKEN